MKALSLMVMLNVLFMMLPLTIMPWIRTLFTFTVAAHSGVPGRFVGFRKWVWLGHSSRRQVRVRLESIGWTTWLLRTSLGLEEPGL